MVKNLVCIEQVFDPELACSFAEDVCVVERIVASERDEHAAGEIFVKHEDDGGAYGSADRFIAQGNKFDKGRGGVAAAMTVAIPTNNKPPQRDVGVARKPSRLGRRPK